MKRFAVLAALMICCISNWTEVDLFVPSFPQMLEVFQATPELLQLTLSINFIGLFSTAIVAGPLSDSFGRRGLMLLGMGLYCLGSFICVHASNMILILTGRFIQGCGVGFPAVILLAVLADLYVGEEQAKIVGYFNAIVSGTMAIAPVVGSYINYYFGWQANFTTILILAVLSLGCLVFWLPDTLPKEKRRPFQLFNILKEYRIVLSNGEGTLYNIGLSAFIAAYIVFVANTPLFFMEELEIPLSYFGFYQGAVVATFSILSFLAGSFIARIGAKRCLIVGGYVCLLGSIALLLSCLLFPRSALLITLSMMICTAGMIFPSSLLYVQYIELFPEQKASAAGLYLGLRLFTQSLATALAGWLYNKSFFPVACIVFFACAVTAGISHYAGLSKKEPPITKPMS